MPVDPRLDDIDDCLYRVAVRVLIIKHDKVLLIKEARGDWWALPGGGINHGEAVKSALARELDEELGVPEDLFWITTEISEWAWFTKDEFLSSQLNSSFSKDELAKVIFEK